jgi:hypothetical protein
VPGKLRCTVARQRVVIRKIDGWWTVWGPGMDLPVRFYKWTYAISCAYHMAGVG